MPPRAPLASVCALALTLVSAGAWADAAPNPEKLLQAVDKQANNFKDATFQFKMRIKEPGGQAREIEFSTLQKGTQKRLVRFISPGDIAGMGMLMENPESMYVLLPQFGNRVRRMGTHAKGQSFFGSDLNSEDMSATEFAPLYQPGVASKDGDKIVLPLDARPGKQVEFPHLKLWIDPAHNVITRIEYYDAAGKKLRTQERTDWRTEGGFYEPWKLIFTDHRRNEHQTELVLEKAQYNTGLDDGEFTVRALERGN